MLFRNAILIVLTLDSLKSYGQNIHVRDDFKKYFAEASVAGSFSLYDVKENKYILYNKAQFKQPMTPASTFKICNSLIGLETGVIADENFVIKWDGVKRWRDAWNQDQDLKTAYKNSCVPYYQELARRVGGERMSLWLDRVRYGNADTSGGIDLFWLNGSLRITPEQQLDFLKRLYKEELPFSKRSMQIVKKIMIEEATPVFTLRTKTGMAEWESDSAGRGKALGWYVGYVTKGEETYVFATCIQSEKTNDEFAAKRKQITRRILARLRVLPLETK
jgi:beta-lactamase class D